MDSYPHVLITGINFDHQDITIYANGVHAYVVGVKVEYKVWFDEETYTEGKITFKPNQIDYSQLGNIRKAVENLFK